MLSETGFNSQPWEDEYEYEESEDDGEDSDRYDHGLPFRIKADEEVDDANSNIGEADDEGKIKDPTGFGIQ